MTSKGRLTTGDLLDGVVPHQQTHKVGQLEHLGRERLGHHKQCTSHSTHSCNDRELTLMQLNERLR